jgi:hypothetical protein
MALVVDGKNELKESGEQVKQPLPSRVFAKIISYIFHPLFIPVYLAWLILKTKPYLFSALDERDKIMFVPQFAAMYVLFPLVSVLLLKALKFIDTIQLKTQRERVIPYIITMIYYWWMWYVLKSRDLFPAEALILSFAIFMASICGLMVNIVMKVSMHAMAAGIMSAFIMLLAFTSEISAGIFVSAALFLSGLICAARFIDSDHRPVEIYGGFLIGVFCLLVSIFFA